MTLIFSVVFLALGATSVLAHILGLGLINLTLTLLSLLTSIPLPVAIAVSLISYVSIGLDLWAGAIISASGLRGIVTNPDEDVLSKLIWALFWPVVYPTDRYFRHYFRERRNERFLKRQNELA